MAGSTRSAKRIHDYLIRDEEHENEIVINTDTNAETDADTLLPVAKKSKIEKPPRLLDGKYFEITKLDGKKVEVLCMNCKKLLRGDINSTGNFMKHIKQSHPELTEEIESYRKRLENDNVANRNKSQKTIEQTIVKKCTIDDVSCWKNPFDVRCLFYLFRICLVSEFQVSVSCIYFISECNLPISIVQNDSFRRLLQTVSNETVHIPSTYALMNTLSSEYETMKSEIKKLIASQDYICTTADVWSSTATSFFGMTLHFINSNIVRKSLLLGFRQMKHKQTYIEIKDMIRSIFADFGISPKTVTHIVTDGGSAFCKAFKQFGIGADSLVEHVDATESEDTTNDDDVLPYIEYDDGEQFYSNVLNLNENAYI